MKKNNWLIFIAYLIFGQASIAFSDETSDLKRLKSMTQGYWNNNNLAVGAVSSGGFFFTGVYDSAGSLTLIDPCGNRITAANPVATCQGVTSAPTTQNSSTAGEFQIDWPGANAITYAAPTGTFTVEYVGTLGAAVVATLDASGNDLFPITSMGYGMYPTTLTFTFNGTEGGTPPSTGDSGGGCLISASTHKLLDLWPMLLLLSFGLWRIRKSNLNYRN